jgi:hypothetical protein
MRSVTSSFSGSAEFSNTAWHMNPSAGFDSVGERHGTARAPRGESDAAETRGHRAGRVARGLTACGAERRAAHEGKKESVFSCAQASGVERCHVPVGGWCRVAVRLVDMGAFFSKKSHA